MEASVEVRPITVNMVTGFVKLSKLQIHNIFKAAGYAAPTPEFEIPPELLMRMILADYLERLGFLRPEQRALVLDATSDAQKRGLTEFTQLGFVDDNYCTWTGHTGFLVLDSGENVDSLPAPPMETIAYNLLELYRRGRHQIEKRSGLHANQQNPDRAMEEPADVRDSAADGVS
jgi:hypothetical protein